MRRRNIVVVRGSAGSTVPLKLLLQGLPADFPGSIFITTHLPAMHPSYLPEVLGSVAQMPVSRAIDAQPIDQGHNRRSRWCGRWGG